MMLLKSNGPWYCPKDMETYQVLNYGSEALYLNIESCQTALEHLGTGDPTIDCITDTATLDKYVDGQIGIRTKYKSSIVKYT